MLLETKKLIVKKDDRGIVVEILKIADIASTGKTFGQITWVTAHPGQTKGSHYHTRKTEWFCVVHGEALMHATHIHTKETQEIHLNDAEMTLVKVSPYCLHWIRNTGTDELFVISYITEPFDPMDSDTFPIPEKRGKT